MIPPSLFSALARHDSLLVAFSGGVDSSVLAVAARRVLGRDRMLAAIGVSPSLPATQLAQARAIAAQGDVPLREVPTGELDDPGYAANAPDRCYFCKRELWTRFTALAALEGYAAVADGTIAGAGLDVVSAEPIRADNPLLRAPNCVITPHVGYSRPEW